MNDNADRARKVRRNAIVLGVLAFAIYAAFIASTVLGLR